MRALTLAVLATLALTGFAPVKPDFGLRKGNVWTYLQKSDGRETTVRDTALEFVKVGESHVLEIKSEHSGGHVAFRYLGQDERGLLSYYNSQMRGPGVSADIKPVVLAQLPFTKGLTWKWVEPWRGQTAGEVDEVALRRLDRQASAVVVAEQEPVSVPAGDFNAVHVRVTSVDGYGHRSFADHWYAFGVGLVKSVHKSPDGELEQVLTKFEPAVSR
jgi:hypothetical protein